MTEFWNSWQDVANNPSGYTERATLLANAESMTLVFNKLSRDLNQVQADSDINITGTVNDINNLTKEIAGLNLKINEVEAGNQHSANEFRDQRDMKLKELSSLIDVNSFEDGDGYLTVITANGHTLVDRTSSWDLRTGTNTNGFQNVYWESRAGAQQDITGDISTGKLKGWIEARDQIIPGYLTRLDDMADEMITAVNDQHHLGRSLFQSTPPAYDRGIDFFTGTGASDIGVNSLVAGDTSQIAAAIDDPPTIIESPPGGNGNAIAMAEIQNRLVMSGGNATMDDFYNGLVSDVGRSVSEAQINGEHQSMVSMQLATYREEVSGVSMDEEMVNMVQFQSAYTAAAKLVTAVDEMLQSLIAMV